MALQGKQYGTRAEADAIRTKLAEQDPDASFFVFEKDGGWIVAKVPTAPVAERDRHHDRCSPAARRRRPARLEHPEHPAASAAGPI